MQQPIVFVGGVHGSGKTTLSRLLARLIPASHVTAGGLIREASSADHVVTIGAQDKAGTVWNLIRFTSPRSVKHRHRLDRDTYFPALDG